MKEYGINYKIVYGDNDVVQKYGNIQSIPTSFIIDRDGKIDTPGEGAGVYISHHRVTGRG